MAMSAWPTLQQSYHQQKQPPAPSKPHHGSGMRTVVLGNPGPKRECAGTGVFIPRRAGTQAETRKKSGTLSFPLFSELKIQICLNKSMCIICPFLHVCSDFNSGSCFFYVTLLIFAFLKLISENGKLEFWTFAPLFFSGHEL